MQTKRPFLIGLAMICTWQRACSLRLFFKELLKAHNDAIGVREKFKEEWTRSKEIEDKHIAQIEKKLGPGKKFVEIKEVNEDIVDPNEVPDLEEVDDEKRDLE